MRTRWQFWLVWLSSVIFGFMLSMALVEVSLFVGTFLFSTCIFVLIYYPLCCGFYAWQLRSLPRQARLLGALDPTVRQRVYNELLQQERHAADVFHAVLRAPSAHVGGLNWNGRAAQFLAVDGVTALKATAAVGELVALLKVADWELQRKILWALGEIRSPDAAAAILPFLANLNPKTSAIARDALSKLGAEQFADGLKAILWQRDSSALERLQTACRSGAIATFMCVAQTWNVEGLFEALDFEDFEFNDLAHHPIITLPAEVLDEAHWETVVSHLEAAARNALWALHEMKASEVLPQLPALTRVIKTRASRALYEQCIETMRYLQRLKG